MVEYPWGTTAPKSSSQDVGEEVERVADRLEDGVLLDEQEDEAR